MVTLVMDWASAAAVSYACKHWHYAGHIAVGKAVKVGAWEDGRYIGAVLFSRGANRNIGSPYGLGQTEVCELARVALREHETPVSRIVMVAVRFLRKSSPGLRLIVSYADTAQGHYGGIYQAMGWLYDGTSTRQRVLRIKGEEIHKKSAPERWGPQANTLSWLRANVDPDAQWVHASIKHRYLLPLDAETRERIAPKALPYPKRGSCHHDNAAH